MKFAHSNEYCETRVLWSCYTYRAFLHVHLSDPKVDVSTWKRSIVIPGTILSVSGDGSQRSDGSLGTLHILSRVSNRRVRAAISLNRPKINDLINIIV